MLTTLKVVQKPFVIARGRRQPNRLPLALSNRGLAKNCRLQLSFRPWRYEGLDLRSQPCTAFSSWTFSFSPASHFAHDLPLGFNTGRPRNVSPGCSTPASSSYHKQHISLANDCAIQVTHDGGQDIHHCCELMRDCILASPGKRWVSDDTGTANTALRRPRYSIMSASRDTVHRS